MNWGLPLALDREAIRNHPRLAPITPTVPNSEPTVQLNSYVPHPLYHGEPTQPTVTSTRWSRSWLIPVDLFLWTSDGELDTDKLLAVLELEPFLPIPIHRYYAFRATHACPPAMGVRVGAWVRLTSKAIVTAASPPPTFLYGPLEHIDRRAGEWSGMGSVYSRWMMLCRGYYCWSSNLSNTCLFRANNTNC